MEEDRRNASRRHFRSGRALAYAEKCDLQFVNVGWSGSVCVGQLAQHGPEVHYVVRRVREAYRHPRR